MTTGSKALVFLFGRGHKFTEEGVPGSLGKEGIDLEGEGGGCAEVEKDTKDQQVPGCLTVAREGMKAAGWSFSGTWIWEQCLHLTWMSSVPSRALGPGPPEGDSDHLSNDQRGSLAPQKGLQELFLEGP